jgi:hypothetical protein
MGGPCKVVERIQQRVQNVLDQEDLIEDVEHNRELTNAQSAIIYKPERERGPHPFSTLNLTPHAQYRMDLRGITVKDVQESMGRFRQWFVDPRNRKELQELNEDLHSGRNVAKRFMDKDRTTVIGLGQDPVAIVTTFPPGPDPKYPTDGCRMGGYRAPAGELSGYRTYPSEKPTKGIDDALGDTTEHLPGESPKSDRERAKPQRTDTKENLERHTPGNTVYNVPSGSSKDEGQKIHVRSPGTPGEEYGHPYKENVYPRRTEAGGVEAGNLYPSYSEKQTKQRGEAKLYYRKYYRSHRGKIRGRAKNDYLHKKHNPAFKLEKKRRNSQQYGWRFNRLPAGGYRNNADRAKDYRETHKGAAGPILFFHPNYGAGHVLDIVDGEVWIRQTDPMGGEPLGEGTVPLFTFLRGAEFDTEGAIDAFFDLADADADSEDVEPSGDAEGARLAEFYRETYKPGDNLDPGDGAQDLGEPSPVSPSLKKYDTDRDYRTPSEVMNNIGPTDNNPGSAKVIPEGHDFVNKMAGRSELVRQIQALRPALVRAAQEEYDGWDQDEEGVDEVCGTGGICDRIADAFSTVLDRLPGVEVIDGGQDGDDHAYVIVLTETEAVAVDIPPRVYETGGGYSWRKRPGVRFDPSDVEIDPLNRQDFEDVDRYASSMRVAAKLAEIVQGLDPGIRSRARGITPKLKRADPKNVMYQFAVPGSKGESYTVRVKGVPSKNIRTIGKMDLKLSCSCNFWQFQGPEHWARSDDYLYGKPRGTAARPDVKDPKGRNRVCKHVLAVLDHIAKWPAAGKR